MTKFIDSSCIFSPEIATQLGSLSIINTADSSNETSGDTTSFELNLPKTHNSRATQFIASSLSSPTENLRFCFDEVQKPAPVIYDDIENLTGR